MLYRNETKDNTLGIRRSRRLAPRSPKNIAPMIDNLLEWRRPATHPSRRYATFAYPTREAAVSVRRDDQATCTLLVTSDALIGQLQLKDAKEHGNIPMLKNLMGQIMGIDNVERYCTKVNNMFPEGEGLFAPVLTREEIEHLFLGTPLRAHLDEVWHAITFWDDVHLVADPTRCPYPDGEVFFDALQWEVHPDAMQP